MSINKVLFQLQSNLTYQFRKPITARRAIRILVFGIIEFFKIPPVKYLNGPLDKYHSAQVH